MKRLVLDYLERNKWYILVFDVEIPPSIERGLTPERSHSTQRAQGRRRIAEKAFYLRSHRKVPQRFSLHFLNSRTAFRRLATKLLLCVPPRTQRSLR